LIRKLISLNINNKSDRSDKTMRMRHLETRLHSICEMVGIQI